MKGLKKFILALIIVPVGILASASEFPESKYFTNSIGMKFVRIEPGTFQMGQIDSPLPPEIIPPGLDFMRTGDYDERPVHTVTITRPFYMGVYEVTNFQYELFDPFHKSLRGKEGLSNDDNEAVINISWYDAQKFCRWLSELEGLPYRLPTEAEWEYACRAGTTTNYYTGDTLPQPYHNNARRTSGPSRVPLYVGRTPPNPWGLYDMHGNVEEWCYDWYGPYKETAQVDPVGYAGGNFRVTRGGSHSTRIYYLRSANRSGAIPETRNWITGFRVVLAPMPTTRPLPVEPAPHQRNVVQRKHWEIKKGPDPDKPYFKGPRKYVNIPTGLYGPIFASHNHGPAVVACPNGDLLAAWFSTVTEGGREMVVAASRLRWGIEEWEPASQFWDAADRNDTGTGLWHDGKGTIYHLASVSFAASSKHILAVRTSTDSGATWSGPRIIIPSFGRGHGPSGSIFRMRDGTIAFTVDFNGSALWLSRDQALTWHRCEGNIAGIHAGVAQLDDGRLLAFGRAGAINGKMPKSISTDLGRTWNYFASDFPPIGGQQRLVLLKLREGPLFFASFADNGIMITDASGAKRKVRGLFAAVSEDGGKTWPYKRLVSDDGPGRPVETTAGALFTMSQRNAEWRGYMTCCQAQNGLIHLLTSRQHYAFNLKWLMTPAPPLKFPPVKVRRVVENFTGPEKFDNDGWADYHAYRGGFNGRGQYTIEALGPLGGINRIIGKGSFEAKVAIQKIEFLPSVRENPPGFTLWLKDDRVRTLIVDFAKHGASVRLSDKESKLPEIDESQRLKFSQPPRSLRLHLVYNEQTKRVRIYYGLNGSEATNELAESEKGIYFGQPLTESASIFFLFSSGRMDLDYFEVMPL